VVRGRLIDKEGTRDPSDDLPVEGVLVTVVDETGAEVGSATSDEDGRFEIPLPGTGNYVAELDTSTLPDGAALSDPDRAHIEFFVNPNQARVLVYEIGGAARQTQSDISRLPQLLFEGVKLGLIIAITAIGLSLIFGTTGLTNFAHGEQVTFGALIAYLFNVTIGMHLVLAAGLAILVGGALGGLLDVGLWRPLRRRGMSLLSMMVVSIGLALLLRNVFLYQFGGRTRQYADYAIQRGVDIGPITAPPKDVWSICISLVVLVLVALWLQRTRVGKATRAVADNPDLAASSGIDVDRVILLVFGVGGALAALGGVLQAVGEQASFQQGFQLLLLMFAGITLGGLGTAYGALVGSFIIGVVVQVSTLWITPDLKTVGALMTLIIVLVVRPQGILGRAERVG
jgi:branched-chain amino acid transport system permease protein